MKILVSMSSEAKDPGVLEKDKHKLKLTKEEQKEFENAHRRGVPLRKELALKMQKINADRERPDSDPEPEKTGRAE